MCKHKHVSLVQVEHKTEGMILTWQCDDCSMHLWDRPIPDGTFDAWMWGTLEVPDMDRPGMAAAMDKLVGGLHELLVP